MTTLVRAAVVLSLCLGSTPSQAGPPPLHVVISVDGDIARLTDGVHAPRDFPRSAIQGPTVLVDLNAALPRQEPGQTLDVEIAVGEGETIGRALQVLWTLQANALNPDPTRFALRVGKQEPVSFRFPTPVTPPCALLRAHVGTDGVVASLVHHPVAPRTCPAPLDAPLPALWRAARAAATKGEVCAEVVVEATPATPVADVARLLTSLRAGGLDVRLEPVDLLSTRVGHLCAGARPLETVLAVRDVAAPQRPPSSLGGPDGHLRSREHIQAVVEERGAPAVQACAARAKTAGKLTTTFVVDPGGFVDSVAFPKPVGDEAFLACARDALGLLRFDPAPVFEQNITYPFTLR